MVQLGNEVFYDSNSDNDDIEEVFHDSGDGSITDGECLNNNFRLPIDHDQGVTGTAFEEDGQMFVQKCHQNEYYYVEYDIYGDIEDTTNILAHSNDVCSLCDSAPPCIDSPYVATDMEFDSLLGDRRRMVYQGELDN